MANHYDEKKVLRELDRKGVQINFGNHQIVVNPNRANVGIKGWGKLDYLTNYCGWRVIMRAEKVAVQTDEKENNYKKTKKETKAKIKAKKENAEKRNNQKGLIKKVTAASNKAMFKLLKNIKK